MALIGAVLGLIGGTAMGSAVDVNSVMLFGDVLFPGLYTALGLVGGIVFGGGFGIFMGWRDLVYIEQQKLAKEQADQKEFEKQRARDAQRKKEEREAALAEAAMR